MGTLNLHRLFNPKSVAVVGASEKKNSVGLSIMKNLIINGFAGEITPINPNYKRILGKASLPGIEEMKTAADVAIVATPIQSVPEIIDSCGKAGMAGAIIISSGGKEAGTKGRQIEAKILNTARKYDLRIIGPNCIGIINTSKAFNASFVHMPPLTGNIAFLSQSGAVCTSVIDLANRENIGFSHVVSLGSMMDVDFADMIDYIGGIKAVDSIVMYMENITNIRNFMSAARSVSRVKPIIALKSGRSKRGAKAAASHTGALVGDDAVYDAAFSRAGILRINDFEELLECSKFLATLGRPSGSGLTIITNAGGLGVMAVDALESYGMVPAELSADTRERLDNILPTNWSRENPIDILGDTDCKIYGETVKICAQAPETDALLLMCSPAGTMDTIALATTLIESIKTLKCPVFTAWVGGGNVEKARQIFSQAGVVAYGAAERAVRAFKNLYQYGRNIETSMETPVRTDQKLIVDRSKAEDIIKKGLISGDNSLTEIQAKNLLHSYGIPVNQSILADSEQTAVQISEQMGYPVVLKICSKQILHKSDCNGVVLDLNTAGEVKKAFNEIIKNGQHHYPEAEIEGATVQPYHSSSDYELIIGSKKDPGFGPVMVFGMGGVMTEVLKDTAMGLPPLNRLLARKMIEDTKVSILMKGYRNFEKLNMAFVEELLIRTSRLVADFPEIDELDINPLMVKKGKITAVDARVLLKKVKISSPGHLIISSYPWQYEKKDFTINGHEFFVRPIQPSDADLLVEHFYSLSPRSVYMRFFSPIKQLSKMTVIKLTQIDYDREIALVALMGEGVKQKIVGVCRIILEPDKISGEFAIAISDQWQGKGIGSSLLKQCLKAAQCKSVKHVSGVVLSENRQMLMLGKKMGFAMKRVAGCGECELNIDFKNMHIE